MAAYEGLVAGLKGKGRAEVIIQPGNSTVPGVPEEVNSRFCHCATGGSTIRIDVENRAGAEAGDWVLINREKGVLKRNAGALLGIPVVAAILGMGTALILAGGFSGGPAVWIGLPAGGLLMGIVVGIWVFRRVSAGSQPFISRIIRNRREMASISVGTQCSLKKRDRTCDTCAGIL